MGLFLPLNHAVALEPFLPRSQHGTTRDFRQPDWKAISGAFLRLNEWSISHYVWQKLSISTQATIRGLGDPEALIRKPDFQNDPLGIRTVRRAHLHYLHWFGINKSRNPGSNAKRATVSATHPRSGSEQKITRQTVFQHIRNHQVLYIIARQHAQNRMMINFWAADAHLCY